MNETLLELIDARRQAQHPCLAPIVDGVEVSASAMCKEIDARLGGLRAAGFEPRQRALVVSRRGREVWTDMLAVWLAGGVVVPLDPASARVTSEAIVAKSAASLCLGDPGALAGLPPVVANSTAPAERRAAAGPMVVIEPSDTAAILFTSGSTGTPKGVVLSHRVMLGNARGICAALPMQSSDRLAIALPFHFTSAICHFLATLLTGARLFATEDAALPGDFARFITAAGATCFGGAPVQLQWLSEVAARDELALRWIMSSGDHLAVETINALRTRLPGCALYTVYGLTELGGRFCVLPHSELTTQAGSVGKPIAGLEVFIEDESGRDCAVGEVGEVVAAGSLMLDEYFADAAATAASLSGDRFRTGDLGYRNAQGNLVLTGRKDDVFKVNGQKVSAIMIQDALRRSGMFTDVAVIPIDDAKLGSTPWAFYTVAPGAAFDKPAIMRALRHELPAHWLPRRFVQLEAIPRTGSGKVIRAALRQLAARALTP